MAASLVVRGVININYGTQGKSEVYTLGPVPASPGAVNYVAMKAILQQIVYGRSAFFGAGATIVNARVSSSDPRHDGARCVLPYPVGPHPAAIANTALPMAFRYGPINEPNDCIQMRFETSNASYWQRYLNFINDSWITGNQIADPSIQPYFVTSPTGPVADMGPTSGLNQLQICQAFWAYLIANTQGASSSGEKGLYNLLQPAFSIFAQVTSKKVGRAFDVPRGRRTKTTIR